MDGGVAADSTSKRIHSGGPCHFVARNPDLLWFDPARRGWMELEVTAAATTCRWRFVSTVLARQFDILDGPAYAVDSGSRRLREA